MAINQTAEDYCVLNYEDEVLREFGETLQTHRFYISAASVNWIKESIWMMVISFTGIRMKCLVCNIEELKLLGVHNYENVMAAVAMAAAYGVPMDSIRKTI